MPQPDPKLVQAAARDTFRGMLAMHEDHAERCASGAVGPTAGYYDEPDEERRPEYMRRNGVAIVAIRGPLGQRGGFWWDGHESVRSKIEKAISDPQVGLVALDIDSPGGVVAGCWDAVYAVQAAAERAGKEIWSFAREHAYSAAYAWAMAGTNVFLPAAGGVGSIGILSMLWDETKLYDDLGMKCVVVRSGDRKARGMPWEGLDEQTIAAEQGRVDRLAGQFFELVRARRGGKVSAYRDLQGGTFDGEAAVASGLADGVLSWDAFLVKAEQAGKRYKMKGVAKALGLREDATEGEIERAATAIVADRDTLRADNGAIAGKLADVTVQHALRTGRITAGEVEAQTNLIKKAPVDGATALLARAEMGALPAPSLEAKPLNAGAPPPKQRDASDGWGAIEALSEPQLARWFDGICGDPAMVTHLASANPGLYDRARKASERTV